LGNPGELYETTRHNLGFLVLDRIAYKLGISYIPGRGKWWEALGKIGSESVFLMKPTTYMNNSGMAVVDFLRLKNINKEDMLIVFDDADLPIGKIRLRERGSSGGHKGIESIIYHLRTEEFPRLRIGIGKENNEGDLAERVLSPFTEEEWKIIQDSIEVSCNAVYVWVEQGVESAMSIFNKGGDA